MILATINKTQSSRNHKNCRIQSHACSQTSRADACYTASFFKVSNLLLLKHFWFETQNHLLYYGFKSYGSLGSIFHLFRVGRCIRRVVSDPPQKNPAHAPGEVQELVFYKISLHDLLCSQDFKTLHPKGVGKVVDGAELVSPPHHHRRPRCTHSIIDVLVFILFVTILQEIVYRKKTNQLLFAKTHFSHAMWLFRKQFTGDVNDHN